MPIRKDFLTFIEGEIQRVANYSLSEYEFKLRVQELKKEICKTVGELDEFINYVEAKYGFIP